MSSAPQSGQLTASAQDTNCSAKTWFGAKEDQSPCKVCDACEKNEKPACVLYPYNSGCCPGKEAHHVVPVRCFVLPGERKKALDVQKRYDGCSKYNHLRAPCVCLDDNQHHKIHSIQNKAESDAGAGGVAVQNGTIKGRWTYEDASTKCATAVEEVFTKGNGEKRCTKECIKAQLDAFHEEDAKIGKGTLLRADPTGKEGTSKMQAIPTVTPADVDMGL